MAVQGIADHRAVLCRCCYRKLPSILLSMAEMTSNTKESRAMLRIHIEVPIVLKLWPNVL